MSASRQRVILRVPGSWKSRPAPGACVRACVRACVCACVRACVCACVRVRARGGVNTPVCKLGFTSGSASVACKQMGYSGAAGFAGCRSQEACGGVAPQLADLACAGSETSVLQCPMSIGDDVFCAPEESVLLSCSGHGDPIGKPIAP